MGQPFSGRLVRQGRGDDHELVAAVADDGVLGAEQLLDPTAHGHHQPVADLVAVGVVHALELVQVDEEDAHLGSLAAGATDDGAEVVAKEPTVGQARERIVQGQTGQLAPDPGRLPVAAHGEGGTGHGRNDAEHQEGAERAGADAAHGRLDEVGLVDDERDEHRDDGHPQDVPFQFGSIERAGPVEPMGPCIEVVVGHTLIVGTGRDE